MHNIFIIICISDCLGFYFGKAILTIFNQFSRELIGTLVFDIRNKTISRDISQTRSYSVRGDGKRKKELLLDYVFTEHIFFILLDSSVIFHSRLLNFSLYASCIPFFYSISLFYFYIYYVYAIFPLSYIRCVIPSAVIRIRLLVNTYEEN